MSSSSRLVPSIPITDCKSLYDAIHKEGAAPASTDKRLAIELATVKAKAVSGETGLRWIDARHQIADCLAKHTSRKSEAVLQKVLNEAQWRITAEEDMLDRRKREREVRNSSSCGEESWPVSEWAAGEMSRRQESFLRSVNLNVRSVACVANMQHLRERCMCCKYAASSGALHVLQTCTIEDVCRCADLFLNVVLFFCPTRRTMLPFCVHSSGPACVM